MPLTCFESSKLMCNICNTNVFRCVAIQIINFLLVAPPLVPHIPSAHSTRSGMIGDFLILFVRKIAVSCWTDGVLLVRQSSLPPSDVLSTSSFHSSTFAVKLAWKLANFVESVILIGVVQHLLPVSYFNCSLPMLECYCNHFLFPIV